MDKCVVISKFLRYYCCLLGSLWFSEKVVVSPWWGIFAVHYYRKGLYCRLHFSLARPNYKSNNCDNQRHNNIMFKGSLQICDSNPQSLDSCNQTKLWQIHAYTWEPILHNCHYSSTLVLIPFAHLQIRSGQTHSPQSQPPCINSRSAKMEYYPSTWETWTHLQISVLSPLI